MRWRLRASSMHHGSSIWNGASPCRLTSRNSTASGRSPMCGISAACRIVRTAWLTVTRAYQQSISSKRTAPTSAARRVEPDSLPGEAVRLAVTTQPIRRVDVDVAVVGAGFAGALAALALRQQGRTVALVERGRHPRFAIGESTTPLTNLLLEELADRYGLP